MIEMIDLSDWKTKGEIIKEFNEKGIKIHERQWRHLVETNNKAYCDDLTEYYIVHGSKGYKLTKNKEEIEKSIADLKKRGLNMLWKHSQGMKALGHKQNLKLELEELEIIDR